MKRFIAQCFKNWWENESHHLAFSSFRNIAWLAYFQGHSDSTSEIKEKAIEVLEWYYRDGSVGGAVDPMEALREACGVSHEWLERK